MIVPVSCVVEYRDDETYVLDEDVLDSLSPFQTVRFTVGFLDVDTGDVREVSFNGMTDASERDPSMAIGVETRTNVSKIMQSTTRRGYLRALRDEINELLGTES